MDINDLPTELLDNILSCLYPEVHGGSDRWDSMPPDPPSHLFGARLVCRRWNELAMKHAFRNARIVPSRKGLRAWNNKLESGILTYLARRVTICSMPNHESTDFEDFYKWELGRYPEFSNAISSIVEFPEIEEIGVRFSAKCEGPFMDIDGIIYDTTTYDVESMRSRRKVLEAVFETMQSRSARANTKKIRSLRLENLQNVPMPELTSSPLFKSATEHLDALHLQVAVEHNERCPDHDAFNTERRTFEPYMRTHWLLPLADQLTTLTLYFRENWGTMPGAFDGRGLLFPHLKTLRLGAYTISHDDHFDWVLSQPSLRSLRLDYCHIASYFRFWRPSTPMWDFPTHDWERLVGTGSFDADMGSVLAYRYLGTWESVFTNIRTRLPLLTDFQFHVGEHPRISNNFNHEGFLPTELSPKRYMAFDVSCSSPWWEADEDGHLKFERYFTSRPDAMDALYLPSGRDKMGDGACSDGLGLNRHKATEIGDRRALEALLSDTWKRR